MMCAQLLGTAEPSTDCEWQLCDQIKEFVEVIRVLDKSRAHQSIYGFVLVHGRFFQWNEVNQVQAPGVRRACYPNAQALALAFPEELVYVEGYAVCSTPIPMLHGWCVNRMGQVVDNTWMGEQYTDERAYFGVPFNDDYVQAINGLQGRAWSVIDVWEGGWGFPLLRGEEGHRPIDFLHKDWLAEVTEKS